MPGVPYVQSGFVVKTDKRLKKYFPAVPALHIERSRKGAKAQSGASLSLAFL
jgi:hypothetical protein